MQVPEAARLFCKPIAAKPGKLVIPCIVEAADTAGKGIRDFFLDNKFLHGQAIHKKSTVRVGRSNVYYSFAYVAFFLFRFVSRLGIRTAKEKNA